MCVLGVRWHDGFWPLRDTDTGDDMPTAILAVDFVVKVNVFVAKINRYVFHDMSIMAQQMGQVDGKS